MPKQTHAAALREALRQQTGAVAEAVAQLTGMARQYLATAAGPNRAAEALHALDRAGQELDKAEKCYTNWQRKPS